MGGVLGLTSDGTRHRPVHRGVWLSETIFNKTPPAPPANVDPIEPVPPQGDKITAILRLKGKDMVAWKSIRPDGSVTEPVSYTHLTLPTKRIV